MKESKARKTYGNGAPGDAWRFFGFLLFSIFVVEFTVMILLDVFLREMSLFAEATMDSVTLIAVLFPVLYKYIFRPLHLQSIEEHRHAEKASLELKESEERFRRITENVPDIILRWNPVSGVEYANPALEKLTGYAAEEVVGNMGFLASKIHTEDMPAFIETMQSMGKEDGGKKVKALEFRMFAKDGSVLWFDARFVPLWDEKGELAAAEFVARNITGRKKAEDALKQRERLLSQSQKVAHVGSLEVNLTTAESIWSDELYRIHGLEPGEIKPSYGFFLTRIHPDDFDWVHCMIKNSRVNGQPFEAQFRIVRKDGAVRWVHAILDIERDEKGTPVRLWGVVQEVTEKKREEETREKMVRLESLGVLAGGIAHDFNNLLTAILGNISLSKMSVHPQSRMYGLLTEAEKASLRAQNLSKQLLTFSKGGAPVKKAVSVDELVRESAEFVLRGSNVRCEYNVAPELWQAYIDAGQIAQVVQNIVLNAAQAMPGGGRVYVTCENVCLDEACAPPLKAGRYVKLLIKDEGGGIPAENLHRIFDPYFTTKEKGSGLGLATAFSVVKKHGGHIDAQSETGAGTTFTIFLPASEEIPRGGAEADGGKALPVGKGKILVMDDEAPIRMLLNGMLEFLGYEASFACDGAEALELYGRAMKNKEPFHCVLLDLTIPGGMGGKETIARLREMDARVNAVVSSGYSDDPVMAQYEKYGFKAVLQKPYDMKKMGEILRDIIHVNGNKKSAKQKG